MESLEIKLNREWLGHPPGTKLNLLKSVAIQLIERGTAFIPDETKQVKMETGSKDKMIRRIVNK